MDLEFYSGRDGYESGSPQLFIDGTNGNVEIGGGYAGASGITMTAAGALSMNNNLIVDGTGHFGGAADYSEFEADGTLAFNGAAVVFDDIYMPMSSGKIGGANQPTWAAFQGNTYEYSFGINDYIHLPSVEIEHTYLEGSDIEIHVHIVLDGSDVGDTYVNYEAEYTIGDMDEVMSAASVETSGDTKITGGTADRTHLYITISTITGTGFKIGSTFKCRFRRIALTGGGNAPGNDPYCTMVGLHVEKDTVGSRTQLVK